MVQIVLLTINGVISLKYNSVDYHSFEDYRAYVSRTGDVIGRIKSEDSDFYRIEKDYVKEFMAKMGIRYFPPIWTFYNQGSTTFTDCFLGVKYFVSRFDDTIKPYGYDFCTEGVNGAGDPVSIYVYKNPYVLPVVFGMKESELEADMNDENLFEIENAMAGMPIYTDAAGIIEDITTDDEISVDVPIDKECNLYFYATAPDYQGARLFVNDMPFEEYFSESRWNIVNIGRYVPGETVNVRLKAEGGPITISRIYIYAEDPAMISEWYEKASKDAGELTKITSSHLTGRINITDSDRIVFSIPYEKSWKVKIDGQKADTEAAFGALLSLKTVPGEHTIDMTYIPGGLIPGTVISVAALILSLGLTFFSRTFKIVDSKQAQSGEHRS